MKTEDELNVLKEDVEAMNKKHAELSDEELQQISGGAGTLPRCPKCGFWMRAEYRQMPGAPGVTYRVLVCQYPYCKNEVRG